jgi:hypothetical protein
MEDGRLKMEDGKRAVDIRKNTGVSIRSVVA